MFGGQDIATEKYGRILADVYIGDIHLNELLITERYAIKYDGGTKKKPISWKKYKKTGDIPFAIIEEAPIFSGCEDIERNKRMNCFQEKMGEHINATFRYPSKAKRNNIEGRVLVLFVINKEGEITKIETKGGDPILQTEALRIVRLLPKMKPGMQKGKPVNVKYALPLIFKLN